MMTDAQIKYLEDVLGVSARHFQAAQFAAAKMGIQPSTATAVIATESGMQEQELLRKILGSIQLKDFEITKDVPQAATHVLKFDSAIPSGRQQRDEQVWWIVPSLKDMLGAAPEVLARKKEAWTLLKQLERELQQ
jgi:hypothetical protein